MLDLIHFLLVTFIVGPLEADVVQQLAGGQDAQAIVEDMRSCVVKATPLMVDRTWTDPMWGLDVAYRVATEQTDITVLIETVDPNCKSAMAAVRQALESRGS